MNGYELRWVLDDEHCPEEDQYLRDEISVPVEPDAIDIAARLSVQKYPDVESPLVLDIVRDTLGELGIGGDEPILDRAGSCLAACSDKQHDPNCWIGGDDAA